MCNRDGTQNEGHTHVLVPPCVRACAPSLRCLHLTSISLMRACARLMIACRQCSTSFLTTSTICGTCGAARLRTHLQSPTRGNASVHRKEINRVCKNPLLKGAISFLTQTTIRGTYVAARLRTRLQSQRRVQQCIVWKFSTLIAQMSATHDVQTCIEGMIKVYWHTVRLCDKPHRSCEGHQRKK